MRVCYPLRETDCVSTVEDDVLADSLDFIDRQHKGGKERFGQPLFRLVERGND